MILVFILTQSFRMPERLKKWSVPKSVYSKSHFPVFLSGSGYVMTRAVAECILEQSKVGKEMMVSCT